MPAGPGRFQFATATPALLLRPQIDSVDHFLQPRNLSTQPFPAPGGPSSCGSCQQESPRIGPFCRSPSSSAPAPYAPGHPSVPPRKRCSQPPQQSPRSQVPWVQVLWSQSLWSQVPPPPAHRPGAKTSRRPASSPRFLLRATSGVSAIRLILSRPSQEGSKRSSVVMRGKYAQAPSPCIN